MFCSLRAAFPSRQPPEGHMPLVGMARDNRGGATDANVSLYSRLVSVDKYSHLSILHLNEEKGLSGFRGTFQHSRRVCQEQA